MTTKEPLIVSEEDKIGEDEEKEAKFAREAYRNGDFLTLEQYNAQR